MVIINLFLTLRHGLLCTMPSACILVRTLDNVESSSRTSSCIGTSGKLNHSRSTTNSILSWTRSDSDSSECSSLERMLFMARTLISLREWPLKGKDQLNRIEDKGHIFQTLLEAPVRVYLWNLNTLFYCNVTVLLRNFTLQYVTARNVTVRYS